MSVASPAQPPPPPPARILITAQIEATSLSQDEVHQITGMVASLLHLPTGGLELAGHTFNPFTIHWHCAADAIEEDLPHYSTGLLRAMSAVAIKAISISDRKGHYILNQKVSLSHKMYCLQSEPVVCSMARNFAIYYISGLMLCHKCSKCFYLYLNIH